MNKTNKLIAFRLTEWEYEQLMKAVEKTGQNKSRFIVMAMLEKAQKINRGK